MKGYEINDGFHIPPYGREAASEVELFLLAKENRKGSMSFFSKKEQYCYCKLKNTESKMIYTLQISYFSIYYESIFSEICALQAISLLMMEFMKSKEYGEEKIRIHSHTSRLMS